MPYTFNCASELLDDRRFREEVLTALSTISVDVDRLKDVEIKLLVDDPGTGAGTQFIRYYITDIDGVVTVADTELDGVTPYVVSGTAKDPVPDIYAGDVFYDDAGVIKQAKQYHRNGDSDDIYYRDAVTGALVAAPTIVQDNTDPAWDNLLISPSDVADLPKVVDWIQVGVAGTVKYDIASGNTVEQVCQSGQIIWGRVTKVYATVSVGSIADNIIGFVSA